MIVYAPDDSSLQLAEAMITEAVSPPKIKFSAGQDVPATVKELLGFGAVVMVRWRPLCPRNVAGGCIRSPLPPSLCLSLSLCPFRLSMLPLIFHAA